MRKFILIIVSVFVVLNVYAQEKNVAVIAPFDYENKVELMYEKLIKSKLQEVIAEASNYNAFTRTDIDAIVDEQHFQQTGMVKEEEIKKIGEMTGATHICVSELTTADEYITIAGRIINIETAQVEREKSVFKKAEPEAINKGSIALANKLVGKSADYNYENEKKEEFKGKEDFSNNQGTFIDKRDEKEYKWVKINDQKWMAENLNYDAGSGSWCYDNKSRNCDQYGRLYNWETAKKVCPDGWHLPSKSEFETLLKRYGGEGEQAYTALKSGGSSGFSALFGGYRAYGDFDRLGNIGYFWSSSKNGIFGGAWGLYVGSFYKGARMDNYSRSWGFSVRCLQD